MELNPTTLLFETINFVVLVLVLWRVLYRPLRRSIADRQAAVAAELEAARAAREEAEQRELEWAAREKELASLREETRRDALDGAEKEKSRILERAREDASAELARTRQHIAAERDAARQWIRTTVWERGTELAGRMLLALAPKEADRVLGERLIELIDAHAELVREEIAREPDLEVEVTGVAMPEGRFVGLLRSSLERACGKPPRMSTHEDPSLVAGWTVRIGDRLFDASIAGQLEAFRELARDFDAEDAGVRA